MANLIAKVSSSSNNHVDGPQIVSLRVPERKEHSHVRRLTTPSNAPRNLTSKETDWKGVDIYPRTSNTAMNEIFYGGNIRRQGDISINMKREIHVHVERRNSAGVRSKKGSGDYRFGTPRRIDTGEDTKPLKGYDKEKEHPKRTGVEKGMGVYTRSGHRIEGLQYKQLVLYPHAIACQFLPTQTSSRGISPCMLPTEDSSKP